MSGVFLRSFLRQDDNTTASMHPVFRRFMRVLMVADERCFFVLVLRSFLRLDDNTTPIINENIRMNDGTEKFE